MSQKTTDFDVFLPGNSDNEQETPEATGKGLRKFTARLGPGNTRYDVVHNLGTPHVIVQTRIAGNVREGGISVVDTNTVRITFGGTLNEPLDVVIIG